MQRLDVAAIDRIGIPRLLLMEHAGLAVARAARSLASTARPIVVCSGRGFNGGDGLAAARHLHAWGYSVRLLMAGSLAQLREEPAVYASILQHLGCSFIELTDSTAWVRVDQALQACGLIIDALLGIGAQGKVREPMGSLIERMNRSGKPILAVDVPSGIDGDTGRVQGIAVTATATVALGLAKRGCLRGEGLTHTGSLSVDPITLPPQLLKRSAELRVG